MSPLAVTPNVCAVCKLRLPQSRKPAPHIDQTRLYRFAGAAKQVWRVCIDTRCVTLQTLKPNRKGLIPRLPLHNSCRLVFWCSTLQRRPTYDNERCNTSYSAARNNRHWTRNLGWCLVSKSQEGHWISRGCSISDATGPTDSLVGVQRLITSMHM